MRVYKARKGGIMRILILEKNEAFAHSLEKALNEIMPNVSIAPDGFDYDHMHMWLNYIEQLKPDCVIYRGGIRSVNRGQKNKELCELYNTKYALDIKAACDNIGSEFMFISSNQVFNGKKNGTYKENDTLNPINNYGRSMSMTENKLKIMDKTYIVRPGWMFGYPTDDINKYINKANETGKIRANCNTVSNPTYLKDLAYHLLYLIINKNYGIHHVYNSGTASKAELAKYVTKALNIKAVVDEVDSAETVEYQYSPENLSMGTIDEEFTRPWQTAMDEYIFKLTWDNKFRDK